jgi:Ca2+-binding RTX toxin-like protein
VAFGEGAQALTLAAALFGDGGFTGTISGFGQEGRIALSGLAASAATLGEGNLLALTCTASGPVTPQLDPAHEFSDTGFSLAAGGQGGVVLSYGLANAGDDVIDGGSGDDILTGGSGHDVFVFAAGFGKATVTDFRATGTSSDVLEFSIGLFADFDTAMAAAGQIGADTVFSVDAETAIGHRGDDWSHEGG